MASFVSRDHVKAGCEAEANAAKQWVRKPDVRKVQVGICAEVSPDFVLRFQESGESVHERRRVTRLNVARRFHLEEGFHGRLKVCCEPASDASGKRRSLPESAGFASTHGGFFHCAEVDLVRDRNVVEALRDAP